MSKGINNFEVLYLILILFFIRIVYTIQHLVISFGLLGIL